MSEVGSSEKVMADDLGRHKYYGNYHAGFYVKKMFKLKSTPKFKHPYSLAVTAGCH